MVLETHTKLCVTSSGKLFFCLSIWENGPKLGQKQGFFQFIERFSHSFLLNFLYDEIWYYLLCSCTNPILENFCSWDMDQSVLRQSECTIFNQPYLQNKSMKQPDFLLADISSYKLKVDQKLFGWTSSKMVVGSLVMGLWNWLYFKNE